MNSPTNNIGQLSVLRRLILSDHLKIYWKVTQITSEVSVAASELTILFVDFLLILSKDDNEYSID